MSNKDDPSASLYKSGLLSGSFQAPAGDDLVASLAKVLARHEENSPGALRELLRLYRIAHKFKAGDLIVWKKGLRDRSHPADGQPAIVIEVLEQPILDESKDAASPYFRESYDIVAGLLITGPERMFLKYHFNSFRFEPYKGG